MLDLAIATLLLPLLAPVMLAIAAALLATGVSPIYAHRRIGQHGKPFDCLKFRTMRPDADRWLRAHLAADPVAAREWRICRKLGNDPRITRFGRFLRASSLDELPQVWNVLRGQMSLVGPRPVTAAEMGKYGVAGSAYLSARPGLTGAWQVSAARNGTFGDRIALDLDYLRRLSLGYDLGILFRTFGAVIRNTGK